MSKYRFGIRGVYQKSVKAAIIEAKKNGFEVLEIHLSSPQFHPQCYTQQQLTDIKYFAIKSGVILQTHSEIGQSLIQSDKGLRLAEQRRTKQYMQFSRQIGARCMTLHVGTAPQYHAGSEIFRNDALFPRYYTELFEESVQYLVSIAPRDVMVCIENDNFTEGYRKVLEKYLKTGKVFLTWDFMKNFQFAPQKILKSKLFEFMKRNLRYVQNAHISGPKHAGISGYEKDFLPFLQLVENANTPIILEILSLKEAIEAKEIIQAY